MVYMYHGINNVMVIMVLTIYPVVMQPVATNTLQKGENNGPKKQRRTDSNRHTH